LSQATNSHFFSLWAPPQRKFLWIFLTTLRIALGALKLRRGKATWPEEQLWEALDAPQHSKIWMTNFWDFCKFREEVLPRGIAFVVLNEGCSMRYLVGRVLFWKPRVLEMWTWTTGGVLKNKIWYFRRLTEVPEASEKYEIIFLMALYSRIEGWAIRNVSVHELLMRSFLIFNSVEVRPAIWFSSRVIVIFLPRPSAIRMKRKGDRGHLANATRGGEGGGRGSIEKDGEKGWGYEGNHPFDPGGGETKGLQGKVDVLPA
jgi:hypothetical protein